MKPPATKKLFACLSGRKAFIIATIMFSSFTEFAIGQKSSTIYFCRCAYRNYGCKTTKCVAYCGPRCNLIALIPVNATSLKNSYPNHVSQLNFTPIAITQSEDNSTKLFESKRNFIKLSANSKNELIHEMEWGDVNALSISN